MKEKPILFKAEMVKAIFDGRKSVTRRVIKPQPVGMDKVYFKDFRRDFGGRKPRYEVGDELWVREAIWLPPYITSKMIREGADTWPSRHYRADIDKAIEEELKEWGWRLKTGMFMSKRYARIWLEVTGLRVEKLQEISEEDAIAEGVEPIISPVTGEKLWRDYSGGFLMPSAKTSYMALWEVINGKRHPWSSDPWLWVIEFRRIKFKGG